MNRIRGNTAFLPNRPMDGLDRTLAVFPKMCKHFLFKLAQYWDLFHRTSLTRAAGSCADKSPITNRTLPV